ncbi:MAG: transporter substrate-binding domain-containing protein [Chloroflexi bacterium]|nr:transporter substrate-binding domain-containing protein [Chloroflexota bacterium]
MKKISLLLALLVTLLLAACGGRSDPTPTPEPTPEPTTTPEEEATVPETDEVWARIQDAGEIVVGVSADYPPFEFYDDNFQIVGYDIALISEIADRLGLDLRIQDHVFAGLGNALQLGQIDVAISALSVTSEREAVVDFSNVYYIGEDAILGRPGEEYSINTPRDMAAFQIGVQKGSVYEDWIRDELVDTGLMPEDHLFVFADIKDAFDDLLEGRIDLIVLDQRPAEIAEATEQVEIVAQGLNRQRYAIAIPEGSSQLRQAINDTLTELQNEGFMADLAEEYLNIDAEDVLPIPPEPPVEPDPPPGGCVDGMAYVADLNLDDNNMTNPPQMAPGQPFRKGWRLQNIGTCTWDSAYALTYVNGNSRLARMGGTPVFVQGQVRPGEMYDFWADLVAPLVPGTYQAFWSMRNGNGILFGQRVWVGITVVAAPTPAPTQTPAADINFTVDETHIQQGECVTFAWSVENIQAVWFYPDGADYTKYPVTGQGTTTECPTQTTTYNLRVLKRDGSVETRQVTIYVAPAEGKPSIDRFTVSPSAITSGQCVEIRWEVSGNVTNVRIGRNESVLWNNAPLSGRLSDCPPNGTQTYYLEASGPGGTSRVQQNVSVVSPTAVPTDAPTAPPPTETPSAGVPPTIDLFSIVPTQITTGQCVNISWHVTGDASLVEIWRDNVVIMGPAGDSGSGQDCSTNQAGSYIYEITAENRAGSAVPRQETVFATDGGTEPYPAPLPGDGDASAYPGS